MLRLHFLARFGCCFACVLLLWGWTLRHAPAEPHGAQRREGVSVAALAATGRGTGVQRDYFHWPRLPVRVFVAANDDQERRWAQRVGMGFDEWVGVSGGAVTYTLVGTPAQAQIKVLFTPGATVPGHPDLVGMTTTYWTGAVLEGAEVVLAAGQKTPEDLQTVAAHEFGHALGIRGHSSDSGDLMFPSLTGPENAERRSLSPSPHPVTEHDLSTLRICYPALVLPRTGPECAPTQSATTTGPDGRRRGRPAPESSARG